MDTEYKELTYEDIEKLCQELFSDCLIGHVPGTRLFNINKFGTVNEKFLNELSDRIIKETNKDIDFNF